MKAVFILALVCSTFCLIFSCGNNSVKTPMSNGSIETPGTRAHYEWQRFKNPATNEVPAKIRQRELGFSKNLPTANNAQRSLNWASRGPNNLGGRTRALALDVTDEDIILAGGITSGMWRSTNGGASFTRTTTNDQLYSATAVAQDTRAGKEQTWYYGTGEYYGVISHASFSNQASGNGIYKSTNGGVTWLPLASTQSNTPTTHVGLADFDFVWDIESDHTNLTNDVVLAAVVNGIYRSDDGGSTWAPVLGLDTTITGRSDYVALAKTTTGVFYATLSNGPSEGVWRSDDGINWINITPSTGFPTNTRKIEIGIAPSDESQVYFIVNTPNSGQNDHRFYKYTYLTGNGSGTGGVWDNRTTNLPNGSCTGFFTFDFGPYSSQNSYDMCLEVHPTNPDIVFLGGTNVYRSLDGFATNSGEWIGGYQCDTAKPSNYVWPNHHPDQHKFIFLPSNPNVMFTASDGGVHKTLDCFAAKPTWLSLNNNYNTGQFYTVHIESGETGSDIMLGGLQDNGTMFTNSSDATKPWNWVFYGDGAWAAIPHGRANYYMSWQTGKTFKFDMDDNGNVNGLQRIDPVLGANHQFINPFILDPTNENRMYMPAGRYIYRHDDLASIPILNDEYTPLNSGWFRLIGSSVGTTFSPDEIGALDMSASDSTVIYFGTVLGDVFKLDNPYLNATGKTQLSSPDFPINAYVSCIEVDHTNSQNVMVAFSNYEVRSLFYSSDGGANWTDVGGNLEENMDGSGDGPSVIWANILHTADSTYYFVGTSIGLFSTHQLNGSATVWTKEGDATIGNSIVNMIDSRPYDGTIAVATHGSGMFSHKLYPAVGINDVKEDKGFALSQNYPNPFNSKTKIKFSIDEAANVNIAIYTIDGKKVAQLLDGEMPAGEHKILWTGSDDARNSMANGTYLCVMEVGGQVISRKIQMN